MVWPTHCKILTEITEGIVAKGIKNKTSDNKVESGPHVMTTVFYLEFGYTFDLLLEVGFKKGTKMSNMLPK